MEKVWAFKAKIGGIKNLFEKSKLISESCDFMGKRSQNRLILSLKWQKITVSPTFQTGSKGRGFRTDDSDKFRVVERFWVYLR